MAKADERKLALSKLEQAARKREESREEYHDAIKECVELRVTNTGMAAVVGVSETAIRQYRKRNNL